jgi:hypothetical protein
LNVLREPHFNLCPNSLIVDGAAVSKWVGCLPGLLQHRRDVQWRCYERVGCLTRLLQHRRDVRWRCYAQVGCLTRLLQHRRDVRWRCYEQVGCLLGCWSTERT